MSVSVTTTSTSTLAAARKLITSVLVSEALCALDRDLLKGYGLLTDRPLLVAVNRGEERAAEPISGALSGLIEGHQVRELILLAHWEMDITRAPISKSWARGRMAFRSEATYFHNFEPHQGNGGGLALLFRYNFLYFEKVHPYLQIGSGFLSIDMDLADQADGFAFQPQGAVGVLYMINSSHSVELAWRFHHISNAYTKEPNGGIDTSQLIVGYAYHF